MLLRRHFRIVHRSTKVAPKSKRASDPYRSDRIQTIPVLNALPFDRRHFCGNTRSLKGNVGDDVTDLIDGLCIYRITQQPFASGTRSRSVVATMKFPIGDVMQQRGKFDDLQIGLLFASDMKSVSTDSIDVPPVMARTVSGQSFADELFSTLE